MKNKLTDLNDHLFAQLERLADEDLDADAIEREVKRADAIVEVSDQVLRIADTSLKAARLYCHICLRSETKGNEGAPYPFQ